MQLAYADVQACAIRRDGTVRWRLIRAVGRSD
jgi:hypothetical protein